MQAWQVTAAGEPVEALRHSDVTEPALPSGHVRCAVLAAGLGWPDAAMCRGTYAFKPALPFTPGQEFCGRVIGVADDVSELTVGDRVAGVSSFFTGHGAFAETTIARPATLYPVPVPMADTQAAAFCIPFHTAHAALEVRARLQPDEVLLVHGGAGGTGSAAIQLGVALGARVIATAGGSDKVTVCRDLGADLVIDHRDSPFVEAVLEATDGHGADVIFDPVGGEVYEQSFGCLATHGRILPVGLASGRWGQTPIGPMALKNITIMTASPTGYDRATALGHHASLVDRFEDGQIAPLVGAIVSFTEIPAALQRIADRSSIGRTVAVGAG